MLCQPSKHHCSPGTSSSQESPAEVETVGSTLCGCWDTAQSLTHPCCAALGHRAAEHPREPGTSKRGLILLCPPGAQWHQGRGTCARHEVRQVRVQQPRLPSAEPQLGTGCWCCSSEAAATASGCVRSGAGGAQRPGSSARVRRGMLCPLHPPRGWRGGSWCSVSWSRRAPVYAAGGAGAGSGRLRGASAAGAALGALPLCAGALPAGPAPSSPPLPALLCTERWHSPTAHWAGGAARWGAHTVPHCPEPGGGDGGGEGHAGGDGE